MARCWIYFSLGLVGISATGCGSTKMTNTPRTGTEQLLLSSAWDRAVGQVDLRPLTGVPVYLDTSNIQSIDQGWVVSSLRQALLSDGVLLREKKEDAQWVVEARVGAYGTDESNLLVGVPATNIPATIPGIPAGNIPEIPLAKRSRQKAVSKLALFAYDRTSGQIVWSSGTVIGTSDHKNVHIAGVGPIESGSLRQGAEFVGMTIPLTTSSEDGVTRPMPPSYDAAMPLDEFPLPVDPFAP
jgi:Family of unknown function (DUF6655)